MPFPKPARRILFVLGGFIALLLGVLLICAVFAIPIPLNALRSTIEDAASDTLKREVRVKGEMSVVLGRPPTLAMEGLVIGNPAHEDWPTAAFANIERAQVALRMIPLLFRREIFIDELLIDGVGLQLVILPNGSRSWDLTEMRKARAEAALQKNRGKKKDRYALSSVEGIQITSVAVGYDDDYRARLLKLTEVTGAAPADAAVTFHLLGELDGNRVEGSFDGESLGEIIGGRARWPFKGDVNVGDVALVFAGELADAEISEPAFIDFEIAGDRIEELAPAVESFPSLGRVMLKGRGTLSQDGYRLPRLAGTIGGMAVEGELDINTSNAYPHITGSLDLGAIDLSRWFGEDEVSQWREKLKKRKPVAGQAVAEADHDTDERTKEPRAEGEPFLGMTGSFELRIEELVSPFAETEDMKLEVEVRENSLEGGMGVDLAGIAMAGSIAYRSPRDGPLSFDTEVSGRKGDLRELIRIYTGGEEISGPFEQIKVNLSVEGSDPGTMFKNPQIKFELARADLTVALENQGINLWLERVVIEGRPGEPIEGKVAGRFGGEEIAGTMVLVTPAKTEAAKDSVFSGEFSGLGAEARIKGALQRSEDAPLKPFNIEIKGESVARLAAVLDKKIPGDADFRAAAKLYVTDGVVRLEELTGGLGNSDLSGTIAVRLGEDKRPADFSAKLRLGILDTNELGRVFGGEGEVAPGDGGEAASRGNLEPGAGFDLEMRVLPDWENLGEIDFDLSVGQLLLKGGDIRDIGIAGQFIGGQVNEVPIRFTIAGANFAGGLVIDLESDIPETTLHLAASEIDLGKTLEVLNVGAGLRAKAEEFDLNLRVQGSTLGVMAEKSEIVISLGGGAFVLKDPNTEGTTSLNIERAELRGERGDDARIHYTGDLDGFPIVIDGVTDGFDALLQGVPAMKLAMDAEIAGTVIGLAGSLTRPLDQADLDFDVKMESANLRYLSDFLGLDLPPAGPYSLKGRIKVVESGYSLTALDLSVGETDFSGNVSVVTARESRPRIDVDLSSNSFRLDDFKFEGWSSRRGTEDPKKVASAVARSRRQEASGGGIAGAYDNLIQADRRLMALTSEQALKRVDASLDLDVRRVLSGPDKLGEGRLELALNDGRLEIDPVAIEIPGGGVKIELMYRPYGNKQDSRILVEAENFDYGALVRAINPKATEIGGTISVAYLAEEEGDPVGNEIFTETNGYLRFELAPENLKAGAFDFWATNLVLLVLSSLGEADESTINCIVGDISFEDGISTPETLIIDTTHVRAEGAGQIDFKKRTLDLRFEPTPKEPQFFSIETPVTLQGTFDQPEQGLGNLGVAGLASRLVANTVLFPAKLATARRIPKDGSDICVMPMPKGHAEATPAAEPAPVEPAQRSKGPRRPRSRRIGIMRR